MVIRLFYTFGNTVDRASLLVKTKMPYIEIPKTALAPAEPKAYSFLTTFVVEIRNEIHRLIYQQDEPIFLIQPFAFEMEEFYYDELDSAKLPSHVYPQFRPGISLLLCCRQLYHESASVLYSSNEFVFTWPHHLPNDYIAHIEWSASWLKSLGSQYGLLKKVIIDMSPVCLLWRDEIEGYDGRFDALPLLRIIWANSEADCNILLAYTTETLGRELNGRIPKLGPKPGINIRILNNAVTAIGKKDALRIKKYAGPGRLLDNVLLSRDGSYGTVVYRASKGCAYALTDFALETEGSSRPPAAYVERSGLLRLPKIILDRIYKYVIVSPPGITFDLDRRVARGLDPGLFGVEYEGRQQARYLYIKCNQFTFVMTTVELKSSFLRFSVLRKFCTEELSNSV